MRRPQFAPAWVAREAEPVHLLVDALRPLTTGIRAFQLVDPTGGNARHSNPGHLTVRATPRHRTFVDALVLACRRASGAPARRDRGTCDVWDCCVVAPVS